ncbi:MAG: (2Fe-2S)-binding protein [Synergistetes bacterium]|nr:(2Fe-2S)-binding protein [Synergistota bacterium]MCX8128280.1 (2Fe-2S)-binding protein [Synergistota bacterium]MDW8192593.1 (2Fe-2S)-binding protein [Synergistota bacterium]
MGWIGEHPILSFKHGRKVKFYVDGRECEGYEGEPIAAALHANGIKVYRRSVKLGRPRGFFCAVGKCSSCFMVVNGVPNVRVCITPLKEGMRIQTQTGKGEIR